MHIQFLAGAVFAWVIAYIGIGLSFCIAYLADRREPQHLVFGLHTQALAIHALGFTLGYTHATPSEARFAVAVSAGGILLGSVLLLHFALLCARLTIPVRLMRAAYIGAVLLEVANGCGWLFAVTDAHGTPIEKLGLGTPMHVQATALGTVAVAFVVGARVVSTVLLARAVASGQKQGIAPFVGAALMAATTVHDALLVTGFVKDTWLGPFGDAAFIFIMTGAFVVRSAMLSKELTEQSAELKRRSGELRHSYEELREAQRELTRKEQLAAIGELAAVIAHEIRNPLAVISNAVAGLRRREIGAEDRETLLTILKEESSRLNRLVGDLLRYARPVKVQRQLLSIREIVDRTLVSAALKDGIETEVCQDGEVHSIWGDPGLLRQVFDNLVDNAVQAMSSSPHEPRKLGIAFRSDVRNGIGGVCVEVQDSGEGMDSNVRQRAKDPFFTTRPSGTGLGLAIVDRIVEAHDGEIRIVSNPQSGTTVSVFLPIGAPVPPSSSPLTEALAPSNRRHDA